MNTARDLNKQKNPGKHIAEVTKMPMSQTNNQIQYPKWAQLVKDFGGLVLTTIGIVITLSMLIPIKTDVGTLKTDVGTLKTDVGTLKTDMKEVKEGIQVLLKK